ncbi:MAG: hypothetical protein DWH91_18280 [Planctomycetota bacterium]|nr:MAG: hypothetical protein DWH91_18280 [Planctomycetota bacterium]
MESLPVVTPRFRIRFAGDHARYRYCVTLGPVETLHPLQREFCGGDEITVGMVARPDRRGCVDLEFDDGMIAYEYPVEYFTILGSE